MVIVLIFDNVLGDSKSGKLNSFYYITHLTWSILVLLYNFFSSPVNCFKELIIILPLQYFAAATGYRTKLQVIEQSHWSLCTHAFDLRLWIFIPKCNPASILVIWFLISYLESWNYQNSVKYGNALFLFILYSITNINFFLIFTIRLDLSKNNAEPRQLLFFHFYFYNLIIH